MKFLLICSLCLISFKGISQKTFVAIGYTMANTTLKNAYHPHYSYQSIPNDLSTAELAKDKFFWGNWHVKMGFVEERAYFDMDMSFLTQTFCTAMYDRIANKSVKPNHQVGVGKLRKTYENFETFAAIDDTIIRFASDVNFWSMDLAFGKKFMVGGYFATTAMGVQSNIVYNNTGGNQSLGFTPHNYVFGSLDLGVHYLFGEDNMQALASFRAGRLRVWKNSHNGEYKRGGLELYPSLKIWFGEQLGLYMDVFYKYRFFPKKEVIDDWSSSADGVTMGTLPSIAGSSFGITLGVYLPYWNLN